MESSRWKKCYVDAVVKKQQFFFKYSFVTEKQVTNSSPVLHIEKAGKYWKILKL